MGDLIVGPELNEDSLSENSAFKWGIMGHEEQIKMLESDLVSGNLACGYLFAGTAEIGKFSIARKMAQILQCEKRTGCGECSNCRQLAAGCHLDTFLVGMGAEDGGEGEAMSQAGVGVFAEGGGGVGGVNRAGADGVAGAGKIKIAEVRKIVEMASSRTRANYQIFLIKNAERMTGEAANCFLKTLEEPPERTLFILTTGDLAAIQPTVASRVRVLRFFPAADDFLLAQARKLFPDRPEEVLRRTVHLAMGKAGKIIRFLRDTGLNAIYEDLAERAENIGNEEIDVRFAYAEKLATEPEAIRIFLEILAMGMRENMLKNSAQAGHYRKILLNIQDATDMLKKNVNKRMILENLFLNI